VQLSYDKPIKKRAEVQFSNLYLQLYFFQ